ncbi:MAG: methylmalonyl-CoA mutase family protein, partial [Bacteroidales bacterium]|nr:methylmalonyl-CoA mutase family protein [Bacteroidales bacterium]
MRPDFNSVNYKSNSLLDKKSNFSSQENEWTTAEQISLKSLYTANDLENMEHLNYAAGLPPFLRGPYSTMYVMKPWTIRQYAGFSTAEESNALYR